jgi:predicted kinase
MNYKQLNDLVAKAGKEPDWNTLRYLMPFLHDLEKTPQDKHWHPEGDVWIHTQMVVRECVNSATYKTASPEEKFILFYAALFHDIGKPATTKTEEDGRISSKGHSGRGAEDARLFLWNAGVPFSMREQICTIIEHHLSPFYVFRKAENTRDTAFKVKRLSWEVGRLDLLIAVCEADMRGRTYVNMSEELTNLDMVRLTAEELGCLNEPMPFVSNYVRRKYFVNNGSVDEDVIDLWPEPEGSIVHMMHGLPASGKDTYVRTHNTNNLPVLSYDDALAELGLKYSKSNIGHAVHLVHDRAKQLLAKKAEFWWNATHLEKQHRDATLNMIHSYNGKAKMVYLETGREELFTRNTNRNSTLSNKDLEGMLYRWDIVKMYEPETVEYVINGEAQFPYFKKKD